MSKYTAEFVEAEVEVAMTQGKHGTAAMFREFAALLRERESAKAMVTDEMVNVAWEAYMNNPYGDDMRAVLEAVAPMLASARVPDGWKLVPVEPTDEMIDKGTDQHECVQGDSWYANHQLSEGDCIAIYKAMLAAAPKPETEE